MKHLCARPCARSWGSLAWQKTYVPKDVWMACVYLALGPEKQDNNGLVESEQKNFPWLEWHLHWSLELRQRIWGWYSWGWPESGELSYNQGPGKRKSNWMPAFGLDSRRSGWVRSGLGGNMTYSRFQCPPLRTMCFAFKWSKSELARGSDNRIFWLSDFPFWMNTLILKSIVLYYKWISPVYLSFYWGLIWKAIAFTVSALACQTMCKKDLRVIF